MNNKLIGETMELQEPYIKGEFTIKPAEHEIFLSFNDDIDAEIFYDWWHKTGLAQYKQYWKNQQIKEPPL